MSIRPRDVALVAGLAWLVASPHDAWATPSAQLVYARDVGAERSARQFLRRRSPQPLLARSPRERASSNDATTFGGVEEGFVCDPVVHMHPLVPVSKVFDNRYGTCDEVHGATGFIAGDEIPATTFVEATEHSF